MNSIIDSPPEDHQELNTNDNSYLTEIAEVKASIADLTKLVSSLMLRFDQPTTPMRTSSSPVFPEGLQTINVTGKGPTIDNKGIIDRTEKALNAKNSIDERRRQSLHASVENAKEFLFHTSDQESNEGYRESSYPVQNTTIIQQIGEYKDVYSLIDRAHPADIMTLQHNLREYRVRSGRLAHISQCLGKNLMRRIAGKLNPPCHVSQLTARSPESIYAVLLQLWDPHTPTEFQKLFFEAFPKFVLEKDMTIAHFTEKVMEPLIQYVFEYKAVLELALSCRNSNAIPPVSKDKTVHFGNNREDRISLLKMFDYAVGGNVVARIHKEHSTRLGPTLTQVPTSMLDYLKEFIAVLKDQSLEMDRMEPAYNAWENTFSSTKNSPSLLNMETPGLSEISKKPGVCFSKVNGSPCPATEKGQKCPHSHDPTEIKEYRIQRIEKLQELNNKAHLADKLIRPPGPDRRLHNLNAAAIIDTDSDDESVDSTHEDN